MNSDSSCHHRRSIRLKGYDYTQAGAYFVTLVTWGRACLFGQVVDGQVVLNDLGLIVEITWLETANIRLYVELNAFVVMPNHIHGIIVIRDHVVGASRRLAPTEEKTISMGLRSDSLGAIIGQIKSLSTKRINGFRQTPGNPVWQRNYYEHIIRDECDLENITRYIESNPIRWVEDELNS